MLHRVLGQSTAEMLGPASDTAKEVESGVELETLVFPSTSKNNMPVMVLEQCQRLCRLERIYSGTSCLDG